MATHAQILVVEDDPGIAQLLADVLRTAGYPIVQAQDGVQALDKLAAAPPGADRFGLVILDVLLPGITGIGILHQLTRRAAAPPVLVISGSTVALETARELGVQATLKKPFRVDELLETVARLCAPQ